MKLERATPEDGKECVEWMALNRQENNASVESLKHCTFFKIAGILYLPVKVVLMLESVAPNPLVKGTRRLLAFRRAINDLRKRHPHAEIIFLAKGDTSLDEGALIYGFEQLPYKVFRLRTDVRSDTAKKYAGDSRQETSVRGNSGTVCSSQAGATRSLRDMREGIR